MFGTVSACGSSNAPAPRHCSCQEVDSAADAGAGAECEACWVCLGEGTPDTPLVQPCSCPRLVHQSCLARWQLHSAGRAEERTCRFCAAELPSWREAYKALPSAAPIFTVVCGGQMHSVVVEPGEEGRQKFMQTIREIFNLGEEDELCLSFGCKVPGTSAGEEVCLQGEHSYDAAAFLASLSAGARKLRTAGQAAAVQRQAAGALAAGGAVGAAVGTAAGGAVTAPSHQAGMAEMGGAQAGAQQGSSKWVLSAVRGLFR